MIYSFKDRVRRSQRDLNRSQCPYVTLYTYLYKICRHMIHQEISDFYSYNVSRCELWKRQKVKCENVETSFFDF